MERGGGVVVSFEVAPPLPLLAPSAATSRGGAPSKPDAVSAAAAAQTQQDIADRLSLLPGRKVKKLLLSNLYDSHGVVNVNELDVGALRGIEVFDPADGGRPDEESPSDAGVLSIESSQAKAAGAEPAERFVAVGIPPRLGRSLRVATNALPIGANITIRILFDDGFGANVDATPATTVGSLKARAAHAYYARLDSAYTPAGQHERSTPTVPSTFFRGGRPRGELILLVADGKELANSDTVAEARLTSSTLCIFMVRATLSSVFETWCERASEHIARLEAPAAKELHELDQRVLAHERAIRARHRTLTAVRAMEQQAAAAGAYAEAKDAATRVRRLAEELEELCEMRWSREHSAHLRRRERFVRSLQMLHELQKGLHEIHAVSKSARSHAQQSRAACALAAALTPLPALFPRRGRS